ncbi:CsbD family protein [Loigolactobacillus zhaoyuanensis]|uniref:CsbD family protein n=1 Tax=Loigolactobacillus zhaoyuanensis TaxID=2486017 RepID=A0ABW8U945_9LACO|nr:CsbD family protein [Loigolactobacillus zhaoyuanensis]
MASKLDKLKGKVKETTGKIVDNDELTAKGQKQQDQAKAKEAAKHLAEDKTQDKRAKIQKDAIDDAKK